jgi:hypothetical protein
MLMLFVWAVVAVIGVAGFIEGSANHKALGSTGYELLHIGAWACVIVGGLMAVAILLGVPGRPSRGASKQERSAAIHPVWPPTRLDYFSLAAFAVVAFAAIEREWIMVGTALFAILIAVVLPRMVGQFEVSGPIRLKGRLVDPDAPRFRGALKNQTSQSQLETHPAETLLPPALRQSTGSPVD